MATTSAAPEARPAGRARARPPARRRGADAARLRAPLGRATACCPTSPSWFEEGDASRASWPRSSASSACSGCTSRATAAPGATRAAYGVACRELEAGDSGLRCLVSVQGSLAMFPIWKFGSEEQKQQWLPRMAAGEAIGCFGLTEPDFGSDPRACARPRKRDGDDWVLNGSKMWITNGGIADVAIVWARHRRRHPRLRRPHRHPGLHRHATSTTSSRCARR